MARGDLNIDPFEREFFATEALGSVTDALVREAIQNSLDAGVPGETVRVRLALGRADEATGDRFLGELWPHAEAGVQTTSPPRRADPLDFVAIEDHGTRGLEGDPEQFEDAEDGRGAPRNDFYYFWRNVGRSRKESTDRGRWGLGKTVFPAASRLQAFFGLTVRRGDGRALLMGQAVLRIHRVAGRRFRPYGYYGTHHDGFTRPVAEAATAECFARGFGLERLGTPGLSVVIPYPDPEITRDALVQSAIHHYFHPLLTGKLQVEVEEGGSRIVLAADTLEGELGRAPRERPRQDRRLLQLARWGIEPPAESVAELRAPPEGRVPKLGRELFGPADLERLRTRFDAGQRIAAWVRVPIAPTHGGASETRFLLLLERDDDSQRGEGHFVRQGITIANTSVRRPRGTRWLVIVSDAVLSAFLGDAENPAHTEWQRNSPKFKEKYRLGPSTLDFVKSAPHTIVAILGRPTEARDPDLLRSIFSLAEDAAIETPVGRKRAATPGDEGAVAETDVGALGSNGRLVLTRVARGFRLAGASGAAGAERIRLLVAYEVQRGDPFRHYVPLDFRVDQEPITVDTRGAAIAFRAENRLEIAVREPEFEVVVQGFDVHRDLRIKVLPLRSDA
jgi:hypothetical protein